MAEDPVTDTKSPLLRTSLAVVTLLSAVVTVALSIGNYFLKQGFDEADRQLKERQQQLEEQFKDREQKLEESRERIARYGFVYTLLSTIEKGTSTQRTLAVNTARLALTSNEQETLFNGLLYSQNKALADAGRQGVAALSRTPRRKAPGPDIGEVKEREAEQSGPVIPPPDSATPTPPPPPPEPVVSVATVDLHTRRNDKDKGTFVSIVIGAGPREIFTWHEESGEKWEHESHQRVVLERVADLPVSELKKATIKICLRRERKHGWSFDYTGKLSVGTEPALSFGRNGNEIAKGAGLSCVEWPLQ